MAFKAYDAHKYATRIVTWLEADVRAVGERRNCYLNIACRGRHPRLAAAMLAARSVLAAGGRVGTAHDPWLELTDGARPLTTSKSMHTIRPNFEGSPP